MGRRAGGKGIAATCIYGWVGSIGDMENPETERRHAKQPFSIPVSTPPPHTKYLRNEISAYLSRPQLRPPFPARAWRLWVDGRGRRRRPWSWAARRRRLGLARVLAAQKRGERAAREIGKAWFFFIGRFNLLFALGLVWFAVLRGFRVVGCVGLICVSCFGFAVSRLRGPIGYHGWRIMLVCCRGSWTGKSRCQIASELCEFVSTVRRSEVEVDAERLPSKRVPD
jgi:hypothetical protein